MRITSLTALLLFILSAALLIAHASLFAPLISDDAFISLRYSDRLLEGLGLTWNNHDRVEGYSNLLWVLLLAALRAINLQPETAMRVLGIGSMLGVVIMILRAFPPKSTLLLCIPTIVALLLCLTSPIVGQWSVAGLEQPLISLLIAVGITGVIEFLQSGELNKRKAALSALAFGLAAITRPDGALFGGLTALFLLARSRQSRPALVFMSYIVVAVGIFYCGQLAFRVAYYGSVVPNTALIKLALNKSFLSGGLLYLGLGSSRFFVFIAFSLMAIYISFRKRFQRESIMYLTLLWAGWGAYLIVIGGDINWLWRHFLPLIVIWTYLTAFAFRWICEQGTKKDRIELFLVLPFIFLLHWFLQWTDIETRAALSQDDSHKGKQIHEIGTFWVPVANVGRQLALAFGEQQAVLAVDSAGSLPYYTQLTTIDMLGLNDRYIATHPRSLPGSGLLGHDVGNGPYVMSRRPDIVVFCGPMGHTEPCYTSGLEMIADPGFTKRYQMVRWLFNDTERPLIAFVAVDSTRLGALHNDKQMRIPAHLLHGAEPLQVRAEPELLSASIQAHQVFTLPGISLKKADWVVSLLPVQANGSLKASIRANSNRPSSSGKEDEEDLLIVTVENPGDKEHVIDYILLTAK